MSKLTWLVKDGKPSVAGWVGIAAGLGLLGLLALLVTLLSADVPLPDAAPGGQATEVLDSKGALIGALRGEQRRKIVPLEQISPFLQEAAVATEDRTFYEHSGISLRGIVRALFTNLSSGEVEQGGSTITQQYARNAYETVGTDRTILRKLREITVARKLEDKYTKRTILDFYLNTIYFGRGAYGAEAAALTYFKKPAKDLNLSEAAYLAGAIRAPERFQPDEDPEAVVRIRNQALLNMVAAGYLTEAEAAQGKSEDILGAFALGPTQLDTSRAGFFMEHVRRVLKTDEFGFTDAEVLGGGLTVHTSLDLTMQQAAEAAISSTLDQPTDPEAALVAMDPQGYVRAMVGGRDVVSPVRALGFNFAANVGDRDGGRQAGSVLKPIALAAFIEEGGSLRDRYPGPRNIELNSPLCRNADGSTWEVSNFESAGFGTVDITQATANSVNTVYAQMMNKVVTPTKFVQQAQKLGISIPNRDKGCALTLGTTDVTPMEMARAFMTFGARGQRPETVVITRIVAPGGDVIKEFEPRSEQVMTENTADSVNYALQRVVSGGTGTGARLGQPAAGKTGTTGNHVDAWFAGYTPALSAVVWMGHPPDESGSIPNMTDVRGRRVTGGSFPATIWKKFMTPALKGLKSGGFVEPEEFNELAVPSPAVCPSLTVAGPDGGCIADSPMPDLPVPDESPFVMPPLDPIVPSPVPVTSPTASISPSISPSPSSSPMPSPSPSPSPTPSPS